MTKQAELEKLIESIEYDLATTKRPNELVQDVYHYMNPQKIAKAILDSGIFDVKLPKKRMAWDNWKKVQTYNNQEQARDFGYNQALEDVKEMNKCKY